jgi:hypothetical protein
MPDDVRNLMHIGTLIAVAALTFWQTWRKWGDVTDVGYTSKNAKQFLGIKYVRGFDGKPHLVPLPFHLRLALSLIPALLVAIAVEYVDRLFR